MEMRLCSFSQCRESCS